MPTHEKLLQAEQVTSTFAALLKEHLKKRFDYKRLRVSQSLSRTVFAKTAKYELYFRVTPLASNHGWDNHTLVIARICFRDQRQGHGTALLQFLVDIAGKLPYTHIGIEQANPDATAFGTRFGFTRYGKGKDLLASVDCVRKHVL
ncbi:GNAT family N-acetyltransferase [Pseudomonas seleniipraecipitans]|uniref:GNAT family N-acetyltransferase n=1 Tax=Phytopseudomonas seleniipraecipitans TaxID=640205 RepID=A0ABY5J8X3_9GAMM|nr:GNAT family N-acetyltransferase [Pseudomonas seleniipraecipitans]UUD64504.1 GNAT family N-acetyltransferase [Pseudomonas seleniipraecipitans]